MVGAFTNQISMLGSVNHQSIAEMCVVDPTGGIAME